MGILKEKSISALASGFSNFENKKDTIKNADFRNFETFLKSFLNTSDKKQRKKLAEEFKARHTEIYEFLKENPSLVSNETELNGIIALVQSGSSESTENKKISNLFDIIEEGLRNDI